MNEATFSRNFMKAWQEHCGCLFSHKVADVPMTWMSDKKHVKLPRAVDYFVCLNGRFLAIEWKLHKTTAAIPLTKVRDEQIKTLQQVERAGGTGLLAIGHYCSSGSAVYVLGVDDWTCLDIRARVEDRRSIPLDWLADYRYERNRLGRRLVWDFEKIFNLGE